jgi:hypothetical protein
LKDRAYRTFFFKTKKKPVEVQKFKTDSREESGLVGHSGGGKKREMKEMGACAKGGFSLKAASSSLYYN